jgi:hypothetical protein
MRSGEIHTHSSFLELSYNWRPEVMEQEEIRQLWADGQSWVIKRQHCQYFYRPEGKFGEWKPGLPPDTFQPDIDILFDQ